MTKGNKLRTALITSAVSLCACVALLAGSTYAWFTDSVTSGNNVITAGNLDIEAYAYSLDLDTKPGTKYEVDGKEMYFSSTGYNLDQGGAIITETLWEPGCSNAKLLTVSNVGTLSTKIKISFTTSGDLEGALWYDFIQVDGTTTTGSLDKKDMSTLCDYASNITFTLGAKDSSSDSVSFIFYYGMYDTAGNEYQGKDFTASVTIIAAQAAVESDGFGTDYDEGAEFPVVNSNELNKALSQAQSGDTVTLYEGTYTLDSTTTIAEGVTITGAGTDSTTIVVPATASGSNTTGLVIDSSDVTISNVTLEANESITSNNYCGVLVVKSGNVTIDNVVITSNNSASPMVISSFDEGTITISNSTLTSNSRSLFIVDGANGKIVIENSELTGVYTFNVNSASSQDLVIEVTDCKLHGWTSYGEMTSVTFTNTEFSQGSSAYDFLRPQADTTLTNCTFDSNFRMGAGTSGFNITITSSVFSGTTLTADNLYTMLDQTSPDLGYLQNCTITVDGSTVTKFSA